MSGRLQGVLLLSVCLMASVVLALPLFDPGLGPGSDVALHVGNVVECARLIRDAPPPWDWIPEIAGGRGGPNYIYYGSLAFVLPAVLVNLGIAPVLAVKIFITFTFLVGAVSSLIFCRLHGDRVGAVAGTVLFLSNPYLVSLPYVRGSYPEFLACALCPMVLYFAHRWVKTRRFRFLAPGALALAFVICTHTLSLILVVPMVALYSYFIGLIERRRGFTADVAVFIITALLLSTHFLVGPLTETGKIEVVNQFERAELYKTMGVPWYSLLNRLPVEPHIVSHAIPGRVHIVAWGCALVGVVAGRGGGRGTVVVLVGLSLLGIVLSEATVARATVELVPPLKYLQFPWRWLATFNLFAAAAFASLFREESIIPAPWRFSVLIASALAALGLSMYGIPEQRVGHFRTETLEGIRESLTTLDHENKYMPRGVALPRQPAPAVLLELSAGGINEHHENLNDHKFSVTVPVDTTARFHQYYFDGWRCEIDGVRVELGREAGTGTCLVEIPAGTHTVRLYFSRTPTRLAALWISIGTAFVLLGMLYRCLATGTAERTMRSVTSTRLGS